MCVGVCPLDLLAIAPRDAGQSYNAYMKSDECWYCLPCEVDCPTGAVSVRIPHPLR